MDDEYVYVLPRSKLFVYVSGELVFEYFNIHYPGFTSSDVDSFIIWFGEIYKIVCIRISYMSILNECSLFVYQYNTH
jgi:hypothetical protein